MNKNKLIIFLPGDMWFAYMRPHITNYFKTNNLDITNAEFYMYISDNVYKMLSYDENTFYNDNKKCNLSAVVSYINNMSEPNQNMIIFTPGYSETYIYIDPSIFANSDFPTKYIIINDNRALPVYDHNSTWNDLNGLELIKLY